jgi:hypothetical protein
MAHFAELNENNKVLRVLVVDNAHEDRGADYLAIDCGLGGTWVQTSYNANFGNKFAAIGDIWDGSNFISPEQEEIIEGEIVEQPAIEG